MDIKELKTRKKELGYTNQDLAEVSGVPLGTVQRIMAGATKNPRKDTWAALEKALGIAGQKACGDPTSQQAQGDGTNDPYAISDDNGSKVIREDALAIDTYDGIDLSSFNGKRQGEYTLDDYYALPDEYRAELIDGVLYDMSPSPTTFHQFMCVEISAQISNCIKANKKNCIVMSGSDVQLDRDEFTMLRPDIVVVCDYEKLQDRCVYGEPDLAVEILSPSTRKKDMTIKLHKYYNAGVKVYWMVDVRKKLIIAYDFTDDDFMPETYSFEDSPVLKMQGSECVMDFSYALEILDKVYGI